MTFKPDVIFISAGFDAHKKDTINSGESCHVIIISTVIVMSVKWNYEGIVVVSLHTIMHVCLSGTSYFSIILSVCLSVCCCCCCCCCSCCFYFLHICCFACVQLAVLLSTSLVGSFLINLFLPFNYPLPSFLTFLLSSCLTILISSVPIFFPLHPFLSFSIHLPTPRSNSYPLFTCTPLGYIALVEEDFEWVTSNLVSNVLYLPCHPCFLSLSFITFFFFFLQY